MQLLMLLMISSEHLCTGLHVKTTVQVLMFMLVIMFSTHLFTWLQNNLVEVIRTLIDKGADADARADNQKTPLHLAAQFNPSAEVIGVLVDKGADLEARDNDQWTPLHVAAYRNHREAVIALCQAGANPNLGENPLDDPGVDDEMKKLIRENCLSL